MSCHAIAVDGTSHRLVRNSRAAAELLELGVAAGALHSATRSRHVLTAVACSVVACPGCHDEAPAVHVESDVGGVVSHRAHTQIVLWHLS